MVIDISTTSYPHLSYRDEYKVKGNKLLTELNRINIKMSTKHNYIIIPMTVYNILEYNDINFAEIDNIFTDYNMTVDNMWGLLK